MVLIKPKIGTGKATTATKGSFQFQYKARTPEQVREQAQKQTGGRDSYFTSEIPFFTPREGDNTVRILPPPPDADWGHYGINIVVHYGIGADESAYLCLAKMKGETCPICEERDRAAASGEEDLADELRPGFRTAVFVIDRNQEGKGPLIWNISGGMDRDIVKLCIDPKTGEVLPVDDPENGYDLSFTREGQGLKTKYKGIQFARRSSPLSDDMERAQQWLDYICSHKLDDALVFYDYEHIAKVFAGQPPATREERQSKLQPKGTAGGNTGATAGEQAGGRSKLLGRKATAPTKPVEPPAEEEMPFQTPATGNGELPSWNDVQQMDEDGLADLGEAAGLQFPDDGFDSIDALRSWVAEQCGIEAPPPPPTAGAKASWKDRLKQLQSKK